MKSREGVRMHAETRLLGARGAALVRIAIPALRAGAPDAPAFRSPDRAPARLSRAELIRLFAEELPAPLAATRGQGG
ncbi:hypothetical protein [Albidovulum sp.]|uniref:hypothetical protein n=2 Tax=Albidovulum sp. TaxID=1872424 RepID=UPI002CAFDF0D|nr:hypothetical protein [Paracoccaceae bacterium]HPE26529.1 hypothetical protein [Albidovulum sp.]